MSFAAYQTVTCKDCGRRYRCTPTDDYYNATTVTDGLCATCIAGPDPTGYVGGPCPDPLRCVYWLRYAEGPWTCESNHPRTATT